MDYTAVKNCLRCPCTCGIEPCACCVYLCEEACCCWSDFFCCPYYFVRDNSFKQKDMDKSPPSKSVDD